MTDIFEKQPSPDSLNASSSGLREIIRRLSVTAELVGTFILMFCVCGITASTRFQNGAVGLLEYAAIAGLTVVVPVYIIAQTVGSMSATYIGSLVYGIKSEAMMTMPLQGCNSAFWVEVIATFIIMFLIAALTSESQSVGHLSGFVAGMAIGLAVLITVSGGSMNPARSLGPAILSWKFKNIWIYMVAPSGGAIAGAAMFRFLRLRDQHSSILSSPNISDVGRSIPFCSS
ncbi:hypothetical protein JHK82_026809 [Glycine max]|nr:hypothetical protein JHK82_026809 [Glycine max]KAG5150566.1 hypothetical protein JHK84_027038 [Glycine max]